MNFEKRYAVMYVATHAFIKVNYLYSSPNIHVLPDNLMQYNYVDLNGHASLLFYWNYNYIKHNFIVFYLKIYEWNIYLQQFKVKHGVYLL